MLLRVVHGMEDPMQCVYYLLTLLVEETVVLLVVLSEAAGCG